MRLCKLFSWILFLRDKHRKYVCSREEHGVWTQTANEPKSWLCTTQNFTSVHLCPPLHNRVTE